MREQKTPVKEHVKKQPLLAIKPVSMSTGLSPRSIKGMFHPPKKVQHKTNLKIQIYHQAHTHLDEHPINQAI